jgi:hypothetical protein
MAKLEGWLLKRGPTDKYNWFQRWCVLDDDVLLYFDNDMRAECKGRIRITEQTRACSFADSTAAPEAKRYCEERPFGYTIETEASSGARRRLYYFDAGDAATMNRWQEALNCATSKNKTTSRLVSGLLRKSLYNTASEKKGIDPGLGVSGLLRKSLYNTASEKQADSRVGVSSLLRKSLYSTASDKQADSRAGVSSLLRKSLYSTAVEKQAIDAGGQ